ncbi:MAG: efflux RND transporter permease subunit [bacterium]|nr:efflux RND transporter permease subunit [bacterium]
MRLIKGAVNNIPGTTIIYVSFVVLGIYASRLIPVDLLPPIEPPFVSVAISLENASPEQIEQIAVKPIEEVIKSVEGVEEIQSICEQGVAVIQVRFKIGENLDFAVQRINERLEFVKRNFTALGLNINVSTLRFSSSAFPVLFLGITGNRDRDSLYRITDDIISTYISNLPGVGGILILADAQRSLNIWLDVEKMKNYGIGIQEVRQALSQYNGDFSAGKINLGRNSFITTVKGRFTNIADVENVVVSVVNGLPIRIRDIAEVELSGKDESSASLLYDGEKLENILLFLVRKRPGANIIEVSNNVRSALEKVSERLPADIRIRVLLDFSESIQKTIDELRTTVFYAVIAVGIVTFIFIRRIKEAFILFVSIPVSLIFSLLAMYFLGIGLNIISLSAIIASSGIVIDNSIVVLESIKRKNQIEGKRLKISSIEGTEYVFTALLGSTITNFIVFLPIVFIKGLAFRLFIDFALIIGISSIISLFIASTLIPAISLKFLKDESNKLKSAEEVFGLESTYKKILRFISQKPIYFLPVVVAFLIIPIVSFPRIKKELIPVKSIPDMRIFVYLPKNANWKWAENIAYQVKEEIIQKIGKENIDYMFFRYGESTFGRSFGRAQRFTEADNLILLGVRLKDYFPYFTAYNIISEILSSKPDIEDFRIIPANPVNLFIFGQSRSIELKLYSELADQDYVAFLERLEKITDELEKLDFVLLADVEQSKPVPELQVRVWEAGKSLNITPAYLGDFLTTLITGVSAGTFTRYGEDITILLRTKEGRDISIENFKRTPVKPPFSFQRDGFTFLSDIAQIKFGLTPSEIERINGIRVGRISADTTGSSFTDAQKIKDFINEKFPDMDVEFGGGVRETRQTFSYAIIAILLGVFLVYSAMVVILKSFTIPFIILFTIPLAVTGAFIALFITGTPFSVLTAISIFLLSGIVVNNGIVLLDVVEKKEEEEGLPWYEALIEGAGSRLRPVLMTSFTTILGLTPSIFTESESLVGGKNFAIPSIGGMIISTFLTLIFIPALYSITRKILKRKPEVNKI